MQVNFRYCVQCGIKRTDETIGAVLCAGCRFNKKEVFPKTPVSLKAVERLAIFLGISELCAPGDVVERAISVIQSLLKTNNLPPQPEWTYNDLPRTILERYKCEK